MPPRRTRQLKSLKGRVQRLLTRADYEKLLSRSSKRLVVIHYLTSSSPAQQLQSIRAHLNKVSKQRELSNVLFGEVDVSQPGFEGLAATHGVTTLPALHLWKDQVSVEVLTGMALGSVAQKCIEHAGKGSAEPASRWKRLLAGALLIGSVAAAGYFGYRHQKNAGCTSAAAQLTDVDAKIKEVKTRLAYVTRRKLHKSKREQQKKLKALEERRQTLIAGQKQVRSSLRHHSDTEDSDSDDSGAD